MHDVVVIGGGAAGIFAAICAKEQSPSSSVLVLEQSPHLLAKVFVSGGGRCNLTNALFDPKKLVLQYPRGSKELLGPFHSFGPKETASWFESKGVSIKSEDDGRMFPSTNSSQTIIDCLLKEASRLQVAIAIRCGASEVKAINNCFHITSNTNDTIISKKLILATGSNRIGYDFAQKLGHSIAVPAPSLFPLKITSNFLHSLRGISINPAELNIANTAFKHKDSLLITHFGLSGPCAIKLSAKAARYLYEHQYSCDVIVNWMPELTEEELLHRIIECKQQHPKKQVSSENPYQLTKPFWKAITSFLGETCYKDASKEALKACTHKLHHDLYRVSGRVAHKEEFVTCGGIVLHEVQCKTMESKIVPGLFFAGEILDIDGLTGGFNLQNAWTTGYLAGSSSTKDLSNNRKPHLLLNLLRN
jgi:hypothetical protein